MLCALLCLLFFSPPWHPPSSVRVFLVLCVLHVLLKRKNFLVWRANKYRRWIKHRSSHSCLSVWFRFEYAKAQRPTTPITEARVCRTTDVRIKIMTAISNYETFKSFLCQLSYRSSPMANEEARHDDGFLLSDGKLWRPSFSGFQVAAGRGNDRALVGFDGALMGSKVGRFCTLIGKIALKFQSPFSRALNA